MAAVDVLRKHVEPLKQDRVLHEDFAMIRELVNAGKLDAVLDKLE